MAHDRQVSPSAVVNGVKRRYETIRHESDLFAVTLFQDGQPAGPTDYVTSREAAEQLGEQWLKPPRRRVSETDNERQ